MSQFRVVPGYFGKSVVGKIGGLRKERSFSVRPCSDGELMISTTDAIGKFDFRTRKGVLNTKRGGFIALTKLAGAREFEFPAEFVTACLEACPAQDSETTRGGVTIVNTIEVIG